MLKDDHLPQSSFSLEGSVNLCLQTPVIALACSHVIPQHLYSFMCSGITLLFPASVSSLVTEDAEEAELLMSLHWSLLTRPAMARNWCTGRFAWIWLSLLCGWHCTEQIVLCSPPHWRQPGSIRTQYQRHGIIGAGKDFGGHPGQHLCHGRGPWSRLHRLMQQGGLWMSPERDNPEPRALGRPGPSRQREPGPDTPVRSRPTSPTPRFCSPPSYALQSFLVSNI